MPVKLVKDLGVCPSCDFVPCRCAGGSDDSVATMKNDVPKLASDPIPAWNPMNPMLTQAHSGLSALATFGLFGSLESRSWFDHQDQSFLARKHGCDVNERVAQDHGDDAQKAEGDATETLASSSPVAMGA